ncbi:MAG: hypothetical protein AB7Q81_07070 [Gammaproteobacteria bacterium]
MQHVVIRIAAAMVFAVLAPSASANLIGSGDFETCAIVALPGNGASNTNCGWTFANFAGVESFGGGKVVRLETNGAATLDSTAAYTVAGLTVGAQYTLAWDRAVRVNFSGAANGPSFGVFLDTQSFASALFLLPTGTVNAGFIAESVNFVASAASHTFIFAGELDGRSNGAGTTDVSHRLDNVSLLAVNAVPEPAALALVVGGLLAGLRRSPRR